MMPDDLWKLCGLAVGLNIGIWLSPAHADSADYCRPYASRFTQELLSYLWLRAETYCENREAPDLPKSGVEGMQLLFPDQAFPPAPPIVTEGTVPAVDSPKVVAPVTPVGPAAICANAHRKIVWKGKSWKCT